MKKEPIGSQFYVVTPKPYIQHLQQITGFERLDVGKQHRIAGILSQTILTDNFSHRNGDGIFYPAELLKKHLGYRYKHIMRTFFDVDHTYRYDATDPDDNYTKRYTIKNDIYEIVTAYLDQRTLDPIEILVNGKPFRNGNAILQNDIYGTRKKSNVKLPNITAINTQNLHDLNVHLSKQYDALLNGSKLLQGKYGDISGDADKIEYYLRITNELIRLSNVKPVQYGYMPSIYRETSTGRLQGQGVHLQTIPKVIRNEVLRGLGYWNYDFDNCHYSALLQLSKKELSTVSFYNTHKTDFRKTISDDVGVTIKQVKTALISIIYGASDKEGYSISEIMQDKTDAFLNHELVNGLFQDIKDARQQIIADAPTARGKIKNAMDKTISADDDPKSILAHILQGIESQMLQAAITYDLPSTKVLLFDGWISDKNLNVSELENKVHQDTGFKVKISAEKLPT